MSDNLLRKIKNLLDLANDADDEESMTALAKAQELMILYNGFCCKVLNKE